MLSRKKLSRIQVLNRHTERLERHLMRLDAINNRFFWIRLVTLIVGGIGTFFAFSFQPVWIGRSAAVLFLGIFVLVVFLHRKVDRSITRSKITLRLAKTQIARSNLDWEHIPASPSTIDPNDFSVDMDLETGHPFAADLNLTGERSLHQLIDTALSINGSQRLLAWLLNPIPDLERITERHKLLKEISQLIGFQNHLALQGALVTENPHERWEGEKLLKWLDERPVEKSLRQSLMILGSLAAVNIILFSLNITGRLPAVWVVFFILYTAIYLFKYPQFTELFQEAYFLNQALEKFRPILVFLEEYPYRPDSSLSRLCMPFWNSTVRPSKQLARISMVTSAASLKQNPIVWMFLNALVPWDLYFAHRLNQTKKNIRGLLPIWLDSWYELEALNSLANFTYLNPEYIFPEFISTGNPAGDAVLDARKIGHPLIPEQVKICNDFSIAALGEVDIISGSNMSGKSTFLRTIGINLCLAFAGGPVNATSLKTIPFHLFTCINVSDSLSDGISYFYAEVRRLKALLVELKKDHPIPLFFLIDEIFRGTNNRERQIGSRAYVQALVGEHGTGLISTHDLELVHLADEIPGIQNYHFQEEVQGDKMVFDYRLRPGPSPTTNALRIMQLEGLPVRLPT